MRQIYLDYNATTPIAPSVQEAMLPFLTEHYGNPSSSHAIGRACFEAVEDARGRLASLIGADREEVVFTSGGTESNNMALKGVFFGDTPPLRGHLVISAFEHPAVEQPARHLEQWGVEVTRVACDAQGMIDPVDVENALRPDTRLVSIMHANNEIGTVQPLREIAHLCHERGVVVHTDAAQTVGKIRTNVDELAVDMMTIAGHKMYAPKGVGALFIRRGVALEPVTHGAGHEYGLRPGTENVPYLVALGAAATLAVKGVDREADRLAKLRDLLFRCLREGIGHELTANGAKAERLPNTLSVNFPSVVGAELLARIPELCAATGAACHSGSTSMSSTLQAIGLSPNVARGTLRLSCGWYTSEEEIVRAANLLVGAWEAEN
jgi:cysteine desulfurase